MKPHINESIFGSITIENMVFNHDVIIGLDRKIKKRRKKLTTKVYGTSHTISLDEIKYVYDEGATLLILGCGQYSRTKLSPEAEEYLKTNKCKTILLSTESAIEAWNENSGEKTIGLFHVTC
jgi:hypothetical protein